MRVKVNRASLVAAFLIAVLLISANRGAANALSATPASGTPAPEAELPAFAIYPKDTGPGTYFDVKQAAGSTANYTVVLANFGKEGTKDFAGRAYAANVHIRTNGGLNPGHPTEEKQGATAWFDFDTSVITLKPGKGIEKTFAVTVPKDAPPGQYVAALSFETADPLEIPGTPNLKQTIRQTIAFVITVPGKVEPAFAIQDMHLVADEAWSGLEATIVNTGNILVKPEGKLTISDLKGNPLMSQDIGLGSYYAFTQGLMQTGFGSALPAGDYLVTLELRDPDTGASAVIANQKVTTVTQGS